VWKGRTIWRSTHSGNPKLARQVEARFRSELALRHVGILHPKSVPTLSEFIVARIEAKAQEPATEGQQRRKSFRWMRGALKPLSSSAIGRLPLDLITTEHIAGYADARLADGLSIATVNRELRTLRRILRLAVEWTVIERCPKVSMAGIAAFRERVVTDAELTRYLRYASPLLADVVVILHETDLRPDELHRLSWEDVCFDGTNYRYGMFSVRYGKTAAARRILPMSPKVRCILKARHLSAGSPSTGFVFPAPTKSGHLEDSGLRKAHGKALSQSKVAPVLLYSLRHTFATRIASRVDAWTLCKSWAGPL
jgi:integrase